MRTTLPFLILSLMLASPLHAGKVEEKVVVADTPEKFQLLVVTIQEEMVPGERYEFLSTYNRNAVNQNLEIMQQMLIRAGSVANMDESTQLKLFSIQEEVNGILARNADDRLVCTYVAPVGSHIPKKRCHTVRQIAENRKKFKGQMGSLQNEQLGADANANNRFTDPVY
ncbi:hypothetical protein [Dokdonella sp.]|uniref:hypothetical protein n=1 Tax=Dokdonella sp. TaxID=2291710 RepID=UPI003C3297DF